jgi:hypothetical protein
VVMVSGGANCAATTLYDYRNTQWSVDPETVTSRGYQAHTLLANGEVFSFDGSWSGDKRGKDGEVLVSVEQLVETVVWCPGPHP